MDKFLEFWDYHTYYSRDPYSFSLQGMELPEPTTLEPLEKKIPPKYTNNDFVIDFLQVN